MGPLITWDTIENSVAETWRSFRYEQCDYGVRVQRP